MFDKAILSFEGSKRMLCVMGILELLKALLLCGQAFGLASAIVHVWEGSALSAQLFWILLFVVCFVGVQVVRTIQNRSMDRFASARSQALRSRLMQAIVRSGPVGVASYGSAALAADAVEGLQSVADYLRLIIPKTMGVVVVPFVVVVALFCLDWVSGVIALVCYPFIMIFMRLIGSSAKARANRRQRQFEHLSNSFIDTAHGVDTIKAFGAVETFGESILETSERFRKLTMKTLRIAMLSTTVLDIFSTLALAAVAIMLGFRLVDGSLSFLPALTVLMLVPDYFKPIKDFGSDYHASLEGRASLQAITSFIDNAEQVPEVIVERALESHDRLTLTVCDMVYDYSDRQVEWDHLHLQVQKPCKVGLFGPSGCGKTTLLNLIAGFCDPSAGCFEVNSNSYETLRRTSWLSRVSYIPQSPTIFNMTLRQNLTFYNPNAGLAQIQEAITAVGLDALVYDLPDGIDTIVGKTARELSGGEAQRVALARALLAPERDVWILDEPTAHLDIQTECELKERMLPLMEDKLVFLATHRLHWADDMDTVIALSPDSADSSKVSCAYE